MVNAPFLIRGGLSHAVVALVAAHRDLGYVVLDLRLVSVNLGDVCGKVISGGTGLFTINPIGRSRLRVP